jgi:hypothetical protein
MSVHTHAPRKRGIGFSQSSSNADAYRFRAALALGYHLSNFGVAVGHDSEPSDLESVPSDDWDVIIFDRRNHREARRAMPTTSLIRDDAGYRPLINWLPQADVDVA